MEVDEATQATEENVQRHVNALTGAHLEAVIDTLEVLTGPWPGIVAKGQQAGKFIGSVAKACGGGGGGRPNLAQAGGRDGAALDAALEQAKGELTAALA